MATFKSNKSVILSSTDDTNGIINTSSKSPISKKNKKVRTNSLS